MGFLELLINGGGGGCCENVPLPKICHKNPTKDKKYI